MGGSAPAVTSMSGPRFYRYERPEAASDPHSAVQPGTGASQNKRTTSLPARKKRGGDVAKFI